MDGDTWMVTDMIWPLKNPICTTFDIVHYSQGASTCEKLQNNFHGSKSRALHLIACSASAVCTSGMCHRTTLPTNSIFVEGKICGH